ncbi:transcription cofactor vestigial-like protein 4 [Bufo gargarizans]|uniref:transcription cofactor vestigial-like protein 4 n=1 Tax=Bufo gargarizans TaxID=30331 RepID=UPI001CF4E98F|nr:transcription cofactor vestigial-like protein 4 [Bufo gargarizans]
MAVSSLQYTMGISSGFKVYILEGQHSARNVDRYRPLTNHGIPIYPIKRKLSPDPSQPQKRLCSSSHQNREKSSHTPVTMKCAARQPSAAPPRSPKVLATHVDLKNVLKRLIPEQRLLERKENQQTEEQPLALVKRLEKPSEQPMLTSAMLQQMRPSVITCISRPKTSPPPTVDNKTTSPVQDSRTQWSPRTCSPEVEEHFQRSLNSCTTQKSVRSPPSHSSYSSVEDHFSKALGSRWLLIRAAADSPSSQENPTRR